MHRVFTLLAAIVLTTVPTWAADGEKPVEIGLQLYSFRQMMSTDVLAGMKLAHSLGVSDVEAGPLHGATAEQYRQDLDSNGLHASGMHVQYDRFRNDIAGIIKDAKTLGVEYVTIPWIPHRGVFTADNAREAAAHFNQWGEQLQAAGLQLCYHPHGYEFSREGEGTVFDILAAETKPQFLQIELDVFWAFHAGQDPVKFMQKYANRVILLHLKDMKKGTPTGLTTAHAPLEADVVAGTGMIDFPALMAEAKKIGVRHYYIEDESPTAAEQVPQSLKYLRELAAKPTPGN